MFQNVSLFCFYVSESCLLLSDSVHACYICLLFLLFSLLRTVCLLLLVCMPATCSNYVTFTVLCVPVMYNYCFPCACPITQVLMSFFVKHVCYVNQLIWTCITVPKVCFLLCACLLRLAVTVAVTDCTYSRSVTCFDHSCDTCLLLLLWFSVCCMSVTAVVHACCLCLLNTAVNFTMAAC